MPYHQRLSQGVARALQHEPKNNSHKTAKGLMEGTCKTLIFSRDLRTLLKEIDGRVAFGGLQEKTGGHSEEGTAQLRQGLAAWRASGAKITAPWWLALLAEAHARARQPKAGLAVIAEVLDLVNATGERFWKAEICRLKGELILARSAAQTPEAEACFHQALRIAHCQHAKSLDLRAAMSLSRLWQRQGKRGEARELLAPICSWSTEGFDTADLQEAKTLLGELS